MTDTPDETGGVCDAAVHVDPAELGGGAASDAAAPNIAGFKVRPRVRRPCLLLGPDLLHTYRTVNQQYYEQKARAKGCQNDGFDDESGNLVVVPGMRLGELGVMERIGKGSFGTVVKACLLGGDARVAAKIIKNKPRFREQAFLEIRILEHLQQTSEPRDSIIKLLQTFEYKNHIVLVFKLLHMNLFELLKRTKMEGLSLSAVRKIAFQLLRALQFLRRACVLHCDIKPENILLNSLETSLITLIDFGSACFEGKQRYVYIQTRFYRCPEVILHHRYSYEIDMWSVGCVLSEMHTGKPLMDGRSELEQLHRFRAVLGELPEDLLEQTSAKRREKLFVPGTFDFVDPPSLQTGKWKHPRPTSLRELLLVDEGGPLQHRVRTDAARLKDFLHMLAGMLRLRPKDRLLPQQGLEHPFLLERKAREQPTAVTEPVPAQAGP